MAKVLGAILVLLITLTTTLLLANAQSTTCSSYAFQSKTNAKPRSYKSCVDLPVLNSYLHYNYYPTTEKLEIAYRHPSNASASSRWVTWALNPTAKGMVGAQCLVAYRSPKDGSLVAYTSPITSYDTSLTKGELSFNVTELQAESVNNEIIIFATIRVPNNSTVLNQVWQEGPLSNDGTPQIHSLSGPNVRSIASLDLLSGGVAPISGGGSGGLGSSWKNTHGVINAVSWGIMMPLGVIIARYVKFFPSADPAWFYLHVGCQLLAYILGVAGWATGMKLTSGSHRVHYPTHRCIGITLFSIATLQVLALFVRPKKDHKYRLYWNVYHQSIGYATIILSIVNIFEGFKILNPDKIWKIGYTVVLLALIIIAVTLEAYTWYLVYKRKKADNAENGKFDQEINRVCQESV